MSPTGRRAITLATIAAALLAGCGQKGPLTLPTATAPPVAPETAEPAPDERQDDE